MGRNFAQLQPYGIILSDVLKDQRRVALKIHRLVDYQQRTPGWKKGMACRDSVAASGIERPHGQIHAITSRSVFVAVKAAEAFKTITIYMPAIWMQCPVGKQAVTGGRRQNEIRFMDDVHFSYPPALRVIFDPFRQRMFLIFALDEILLLVVNGENLIQVRVFVCLFCFGLIH
jgi:hypothetical protein